MTDLTAAHEAEAYPVNRMSTNRYRDILDHMRDRKVGRMRQLVERLMVISAVVTGLMIGVQTASAAPKLWVYPDSADPRQGGHVIEPGTFNLVVENRGGGSGDETVYGVVLVVAVADPSVVTTLEIGGSPVTPGDAGTGIPPLPCSGRPMPPHSVYPAPYSLLELGDLQAGSVFVLEVTVDGGPGTEVHFDAIGSSLRQTGNGPKCSDVVNPSGHDVTVRAAVDGGGGDDPRCPKVKVRKRAVPMTADVGDAVMFMIEIENRGTCELTNLRVVDSLPTVTADDGSSVPAVTFVAGDPPPTEVTDDAVIWEPIDPLAAATSWTADLEVLIDEEAADGKRLVNLVCVDADELDEPVCSSAVVAVGDDDDKGPASPGFWCHALKTAPEGGHSSPIPVEDLEAWLSTIDTESRVFSELVDASNLELASAVVCRPQNAEGPFDRLARHLLALWLNVTGERLDPETVLSDLCPGPAELPDDAEVSLTVAELIEEVEDAMVGGADDRTLVFWGEVVDYVNNAQVAGETGCQEVRVVRRRLGRMGG